MVVFDTIESSVRAWRFLRRAPAIEESLLDGGVDAAQATRALRIADFTGAVPGFDFCSDALRDRAAARRADFFSDHRLRETKAVAERDWVFGLLEADALPHAGLVEHHAAFGVEVNHVASRCAAEIERAALYRSEVLGYHVVLERDRLHRATRFAALRAAQVQSRVFTTPWPAASFWSSKFGLNARSLH